MIVLELIGAVIRFFYLRIIRQKEILFYDVWKTFNSKKDGNAFKNDMSNSYIGIAFIVFIILLIKIFFN